MNVVVIGGGYAGVMAANRLTQRDDVAVTLINPRPRFVQRLRLHQFVAGARDATTAYQEVLSEQVRLVVDTATGINAANRTVTLGCGDTIAYDYLIYAAGSGSATPDVPGAREFAYPLATFEEAQRLRPALDAATTVTVVGAGATGVEVAAELAEEGKRVTLVAGGEVGPYLHPRVRRGVVRQLTKLGVTIVDSRKVTAVTAGAVTLDDGREVPGDVTVWTAGFGVPDLAARSGLRTDDAGRVLTDETLTSIDDDRILAAGDSAAPSGVPLRMSCQTARPLGAHAADTVLARLAGTEPARINIGYFGQCFGVGRHAAAVQFASRDDVPNRLHIGGRVAAMIKEIALSSMAKELAAEARRPGKFSWAFKDDTRAQLLRDARAAAVTR
jgi:NADH:ubiquinone reductase (H+-translocating)